MTRSQNRTALAAFAGIAGVIALACASTPREDPEPETQQGLQMTMSQRKQAMKTLPGITVLIRDSLELLTGKKVGLLTNQTGIDENRVSDADLLMAAAKSGKAPGMQLVMLFSPEHGIRGTEDHMNVAGGVDKSTGLPIISLYGNNVLPPPDSALDQIGALVIDLQDIGARPWTYPASVVYAMRAAAQHHVMVLVLDRPNPINGESVEGPVLDSALAWAGSQSPEHPAQPTAIWPIPLRHGMTMGELAKLYNSEMQLGADLHVIPMQNWRRSRWFDRTGLPWVNPSPNMTSLTAATLYPGLVILEPANVSVGRGTPVPFQWVGAPWMDAKKVINVLDDFTHPGVKFSVETQTPVKPTDGRYNGKKMKGVRITITDRSVLQTSRLGAWIGFAIWKTHPDSFKVDSAGFARTFGEPVRDQLLKGLDPDQIIDSSLAATIEFRRRTKRFLMYP
jgi:uncharacterized protein YbbC (DUF1343 family)